MRRARNWLHWLAPACLLLAPTAVPAQEYEESLRIVIDAGTHSALTAGLTERVHTVTAPERCVLVVDFSTSSLLSGPVPKSRRTYPLAEVDPTTVRADLYRGLMFQAHGTRKAFFVEEPPESGNLVRKSEGQIMLAPGADNATAVADALQALVRRCQ